jgi:quercetin dioxygenase-like cupin family protein
MKKMTRREMMGSSLLAAASTGLIGIPSIKAANTTEAVKVKKYPNEHFYKADGTFDAEAGKAAFFEMFEAYNYPVVPRLKTDEFWVVDFGLGKFTEIGMGGIFWLNRHDENYFGHEIFLLPGQSIPEHRHVKTPDAGPKLESWQVRHGWVYLYAEGEPTDGVEKRLPPSHLECCKARAESKLFPGEVAHLTGAEDWHFMKGGDQGAIVTEYATYHDGNALRFSHPDIVF